MTSNTSAAVVFMTPARATELLKHNTRNRSVRPRVVQQYARDIENGDFSLTGQPIILNCDGTILDGQHRLLACIESGVGFWTLLVENIASETLHNMDTGMRRTFADYLSIDGVKNAKDVASIARLCVLWTPDGLESANRYRSHAELLAFRDRALGAIDRAAEIVSVNRGVSGLRYKKSVIGALVANLLHAGCDEDQVAWFVSSTRDGTAEPGTPTALLYDRLLQTSLKRGVMVSAEQELALTVKAWNATITGTTLRNLRWRRMGPKAEAFPTLLNENFEPVELLR